MGAERPRKEQGYKSQGPAQFYILLVYRLRTVAFQVAETGSIPVQDAKQYAAVTQWIRVLRYERRSQEFESLRWRQSNEVFE